MSDTNAEVGVTIENVEACAILEQQIETLIGRIMPLLDELVDRLRQLSLPDSASTKTRLMLECLPMFVERPRQQLQQISNALPLAAKLDTSSLCVIQGALFDFRISADRAVIRARTAGGRKHVQRQQLIDLEVCCGKLFNHMNNILDGLNAMQSRLDTSEPQQVSVSPT